VTLTCLLWYEPNTFSDAISVNVGYDIVLCGDICIGGSVLFSLVKT